MPSPYGHKNASIYYQHGGIPRHYVLEWEGLPPGPTRAAETRSLGSDGDYIDVTATFHKSLGALGPGGLSRNEKRLAIGAGLAIAGYLAWKKFLR